MKRQKVIRGTLPPLFDRIVDDKNDTGIGTKLLTTEGLKESIINELSLILNTRCTVRKVIYENHLETIPLFGLPDFFGLGDFSYFDGSNSQDWPKAARFIETAIQSAEPRVQDVHVKVDQYNPYEQSLYITISAHMVEGTLLKEIHFPLVIHHWVSASRKAVA